MLAELSIENFAIIEQLLLRLTPGFTVLTGETGAGKSIIIDALQAALGTRVSADVVRAGARYAAVEAIFESPGAVALESLEDLLIEHGIESREALILRREISASGRSTARINGRAVPLGVLQTFGSALVDIHGQSDHLSILRHDRQLDAIDRYRDLLILRTQVGDSIRRLARQQKSLNDLINGQREAEQRLDLLRFQVQEIESAALVGEEEDELLVERNRLANAERLRQLAESIYDRLQGERAAALDGIVAALGASHELVQVDPALAALDERLQAARYELEDVAQELRRYRDGIEYDPGRLDVIEERLDLLARLRRKYGATVTDVLAFGRQARSSMEEVENLDERIESLRLEVATELSAAGLLAQNLSQQRTAAGADLTAAMRLALQGLGLKGTEFKASLQQVEAADGLALPDREGRFAVTTNGIDHVTFLVSFNPGEPLRPLERVASGGETSRFLLALKSVLADADQTPTLIFDEVDVGVGARDGLVVGDRLAALAQSHQVLSITHLPQIAALADQHLVVAKTVGDGHTGVAVHLLEPNDRVVEIAEMMSGMGTETARRNAEELLEAARQRG